MSLMDECSESHRVLRELPLVDVFLVAIHAGSIVEHGELGRDGRGVDAGVPKAAAGETQVLGDYIGYATVARNIFEQGVESHAGTCDRAVLFVIIQVKLADELGIPTSLNDQCIPEPFRFSQTNL